MGDNDISDDEKALFRFAMRTAKPISPKNTKVKYEKKRVAPKIHQDFISFEKPQNNIYLSSEYTNPITAEEVISYKVSGLPQKQFKHMQSGQQGYSSRLDLHGKTVDGAADALRDFVQACFDNDVRNLLIIHGKGGYLNDTSLIKSYVNHWLRQIDHVLGFHSAKPKDGGTGAVYVLLKRNKSRDSAQ